MSQSLRSFLVVFIVAVFGSTTLMATVDIEPAEAKPRKVRKKKTTGISKNRPLAGVKGGFLLSGSGELEIEAENIRATTPYEDDSTYGLNGFFLFPVVPNFRVGGSVWIFPKFDISVDGESSDTDDDFFGLDINVMGEYALDFGKVDGFAFVEGGYSLLFPPESDEEGQEPETGSGFNVGGGVGGGFVLSRQLALRVDVKFTKYSITFTEETTGDDSFDTTLSGNRVTLNAGVAFGL